MTKETFRRDGFIAAVLDQKSSELLRQRARHPIVHCRHMTIAYEPTEKDWAKFGDLIGKKVKMTLRNIRTDDHGQAGTVSGVPSKTGRPHVTISCAERFTPNYSNYLINEARGVSEPADLEIEATVEFIPFKPR